MRYIRYAFYGAIGLTLLVVSLANRGEVSLQLLPEELATFANFNVTVTLPLFLVILASIVVGLAIGYGVEYLREHKIRASERMHRRERYRLEDEVGRLRKPEPGSGDEVIAILDAPKNATG